MTEKKKGLSAEEYRRLASADYDRTMEQAFRDFAEDRRKAGDTTVYKWCGRAGS